MLLCWVDGQVRRLLDLLTLPLAAGVPAHLGVAALLPASAGDWPRAVLGGATLCFAYLALFLLHPAGIAFGDVKLALPLGTVLGWHGWATLLVGALAGLFSAALYATVPVIRGRAHLGSTLAFGPSHGPGHLGRGRSRRMTWQGAAAGGSGTYMATVSSPPDAARFHRGVRCRAKRCRSSTTGGCLAREVSGLGARHVPGAAGRRQPVHEIGGLPMSGRGGRRRGAWVDTPRHFRSN
ncbi:A24 family peptidase [Streptomyces alkaliterrae]|uniref:A24 family peptidase n=1 Tax=Streptomyces alkaliterrae TaxID=2213162 RepID=UPI002B20B08A|nr:A24 family peptidase [Streptomyces alkaliterrae]